MHPPQVRQVAHRLIADGLNDCEVSERLGVPRSTIREWRRPTYTSRRAVPLEPCPRCWRATKPLSFTDADYSELLAMYLGDGCISQQSRTQRLRISLDTKYPNIIEEAAALLKRCFPENPVDTVTLHDGACVNVSVHSSHLGCLFPQHGPGKKHERPIALEDWQARVVEAEPWPFIRGCIRTDGCAFINRTDVHRSQPYEYLSYEFSNMSGDIARLFVDACGRVGVFTRLTRNATGRWRVRINRRTSVALMLARVGRKG